MRLVPANLMPVANLRFVPRLALWAREGSGRESPLRYQAI